MILGFIVGLCVGFLLGLAACGAAFADKRGIELLKKHIERKERRMR